MMESMSVSAAVYAQTKEEWSMVNNHGNGNERQGNQEQLTETKNSDKLQTKAKPHETRRNTEGF